MKKHGRAIARGRVDFTLHHQLSKDEWMAKVIPGVEGYLGAPLRDEIMGRIHDAFTEEMLPETAIDEIVAFAILTALDQVVAEVS
jgi:hypothetical protein